MKSPQPLSSYTYQIAARGKIVNSKTIVLNGNTENVTRFTFTPTFDYAPRAVVIVYYISNSSISSTIASIELHDKFKNFIDLEVTPDESKPGGEIDINVKSNPKSYIGLLAVDQSVLLLRSGNDLAQDEIWSELSTFHLQTQSTSYYRNGWHDFDVSSFYN